MDPMATAVAADAATVIAIGGLEASEPAPDVLEAEVRWQLKPY